MPVGKHLNVAVVIPVAAAAVAFVIVIVIAGVAAVAMDIFNEFNKRAAPETIRVILVMPVPALPFLFDMRAVKGISNGNRNPNPDSLLALLPCVTPSKSKRQR